MGKDIYKDIAEDIEKRFDTSIYEVGRPLPMGKNRKVIDLMKNELGGQIMKKFVELQRKTYSYLKDNDDDYKNAKDTKRCVVKRRPNFQDYKNCIKASQILNIKNYLQSKQIDVDCLKEDKKEFIKIG